MKFRKLLANEIDARIATVKENGVSVLLYKDARVDQNILDETVGAENWQRKHEVINGNLFCNVGINCQLSDGTYDWVWKQDVGVESYTEKEKGQASDSFKRACFNWGIGRELYTAPFIWIDAEKCTIKPKDKGFTCYDHFDVSDIGYDEVGNINYLVIKKGNKVVYSLGKAKAEVKEEATEEAPKETITKKEAEVLLATLATVKNGKGESVNIDKLCGKYGVKTLNELSPEQYAEIIKQLPKSKEQEETK